MSLNDQWMQRDLDVLWHPCTQMKDHERLPLVPIRKASGVWLEDFDGKRYLDAVSSWWVNVFGHANPRINARLGLRRSSCQAVRRQDMPADCSRAARSRGEFPTNLCSPKTSGQEPITARRSAGPMVHGR